MKKALLWKHFLASVFSFALIFTTTTTWAQTSNYFNGFETSIVPDDWGEVTRVTSGTNGILSATGAWHAVVPANDDGGFTRLGRIGGGSYNFTFPTCGYKTSLDIYLDISGGWVNDRRFDYSSAINSTSDNTPNSNHRRDFVFNVGYYNDNLIGELGAGTNRFVISASNNAGRSGAFPKNPGRSPQVIAATGWYRFEHSFRNNGGVLAVDFTIYNASNIAVATWTLSDPSDIIGVTVGGARYGWLLNNEFSPLAVDNSKLTVNASSTYYPDADGDGYGNGYGAILVLCSATTPAGYSTNNYDCDDTKKAKKPEDEQVVMCHNGKSECVKWKEVSKKLGQGWTLGPCTQANCEPGETLMCHNGQTECVKNKDVTKKLSQGWTLGSCNDAPLLTAAKARTEVVTTTNQFRLGNAPNPLNSFTTIRYELPVSSRVNITLYDPVGKVVAVLVDASRNAGIYNYQLDASKLASGIYYYKMTAISADQKFLQDQKMMIIK